jgi:hypothetical protein
MTVPIPGNFLLFLVFIAEQLYLATDRGHRNKIIPAFWQLVAFGFFIDLSNWADVRLTECLSEVVWCAVPGFAK